MPDRAPRAKGGTHKPSISGYPVHSLTLFCHVSRCRQRWHFNRGQGMWWRPRLSEDASRLCLQPSADSDTWVRFFCYLAPFLAIRSFFLLFVYLFVFNCYPLLCSLNDFQIWEISMLIPLKIFWLLWIASACCFSDSPLHIPVLKVFKNIVIFLHNTCREIHLLFWLQYLSALRKYHM